MNRYRTWKQSAGAAMVACLALIAVPTLVQAQDPNQPPSYPPPQQQQYPPPQQQYPQPTQGQYPQGQYPQGQYPASNDPQGQYPPPNYAQPPLIAPQQLDGLVGPIALYEDGLLAQVLTASTFSNQIPDASNWANQHSYLQGEALAAAIREDNLSFDPSVVALLPFPSVLSYMANNLNWTQQLGNAVLAQRNDVMDAVQRMRQRSYDYGYLRSGPYQQVVYAPGAIEVMPVNPGVYFVPTYDPYIVYARPRPGVFVGGALRFGPSVSLGVAFSPWGWGGVGFGWRDHAILVDHRPWGRSWGNRTNYYHFSGPRPVYNGRFVEHHDFHGRERR